MHSSSSTKSIPIHPLVRSVFGKPGLVSKRFALLARTRQRYEECCSLKGHAPYPVSFRKVAYFLGEYIKGLNGSTRSLSNLVSNLKLGIELAHELWLPSQNDRYILRRWIVQLKYDDRTPSRRKQPACLALLLKLINSMNLSDDEELYDAASYMLAHNLLLRAGELWSGIRASSLQWNQEKTSVVLPLARTKTVLAGDPAILSVKKFRGKGSAVRLLKMWFDRRNLWGDAEAFLFPLRTGSSSSPFAP